MKQAARVFVGHWRITEMEEWDADYFDMEAPAHITIRKDLTGEFQFGLVRGELDGRVASVEGLPRFEFSCQYTRPRSSNRTLLLSPHASSIRNAVRNAGTETFLLVTEAVT